MTLPTPPARRLALAAGLLAVALISCGRELTGPGSAPVNAFKRFAAFAFSPQYETAVQGTALQAALTQVAFEKVRITLRREDGSIALDTVVDFPVGATELTLSLVVPLPPSTGASGAPMSLSLGYVNAAGDTVFRGGPSAVTVLPSTAGSAPPPPVQVPVHYTGTGANATSVSIAPKSITGLAGLSTTFSAQALSATGTVIAGTPIVFTSSNPAVVSITNPSSGAASFVGRGTAKVYAQLLTGPLDSAVVTVTLPASALSLVSGGGQTASAGTTLPLPIVAKVAASDGIGVGGVTVTFAVASGGGVITPASAVSAANGQVSASWKLGPTAGPQSVTVTAAGLSGSPISVTANALPVVPSKLVMTTAAANVQAGSALAAVSVTAQDALGNTATTFAGDVTVALGTNPGGATLSGTTTVKAVNGVATFADLSLNRPGTAYTLLFASSGLASVTSTSFDISTGSATRLVFAQVTSTADAGFPMGSVQVTAQDAAGNTVTTFTGAVTVAIGINPGASTLSGTLTRAAVAGVATFTDLSLNKKGGSYTLTASATGLTSGTSSTFNVAPGAPAGLTIVSGNGQSAAAGSALSTIRVRLRDALNNGIERASIAFAVAGGGGTISNATGITDADGVAMVTWTIGSGLQTMTATFTGLPSITITATSTTAILVWTGATNTSWSTASNWSPAFAPTAVDAITIPVTATAPVISSPASIFSLVVATGATLTNNSTLTVTGSVDAGTTIVGSGNLVLAGTSGALKGVVNQAVTVSAGAHTLNGATQLTGPLTISATGTLSVGGQTLLVTGNLATSGGGRLAMSNAADVVTVTGDANFAGGSESGLLTAGTLNVERDFTASGAAFAASGTHVIRFTGNHESTQTITFSPNAGLGFNHAVFDGWDNKVLVGAPAFLGDVSILATSQPVSGAVTAKIAGNFSDATDVMYDTTGAWRVDNTTFSGTNKTINSGFITSHLTVSGTVSLTPCGMACLGLQAAILAPAYVQVNGNVTVSGSGAVLKLNGSELYVVNFATASGGSVDLTNSMDYLYAAGSAVFGGGSTAGKLTLGVLEVVQDFTQNGAANSFAADAGFVTYIGDSYVTAALRAPRSSRARSAIGAKPAVEAARRVRAQRLAPLRAERAERIARLDRRAAAHAARGMAAPPRGQTAMRNSTTPEAAVRLRQPARVYTGTSNITFANPTSSFFGTLYIAGPYIVLGSNITVTGRLETGSSYYHDVSSSSAAAWKVTSHGADVRDLSFDNVSWTLLDGGDIWAMDYVEFYDMDPAVDQFTIARTGDGGTNCGECSTGTYELWEWSFYTTPTTGHYIKATDTNGGPNLLQLVMDYPDPAAHGGHVSTVGGAVITNWPADNVITWTGASSTSWNLASNWSGGVLPTATDDVLIPTGVVNQPRLTTANGFAHNLTIGSGMRIATSCSYELYVSGNVVAPLATPGTTTCEGDAIHLVGDGTAGGNTVTGQLEVVKVDGNYKVGPGNRLVSYDLTIDGTGNLSVSGGRVDAQGLYTISDATFTMTNALDQVFVGGNGAHFGGSSSSLTAGTLTITDGALAAGGNSFAPSGTHMVVFAGTFSSVSFTDPLSSFFQNVTVNAGTMLSVETVYATDTTFGFNANGTLSRGAGAGTMTITSPGKVRINNVTGLNITGGPTVFDNIGMRLFVGTANKTLNTVAFTGGYAGYTGPILKVHRNSPEIVQFNALDFSLVTGLGTGGVFLDNSNTATVNIRASNPSIGTLGVQYSITGAGAVSWSP